MRTAASSMFDPAPAELRRMNRVITWSVAIHIGVFAFVLVTPRSWWRAEPEPREVMTISLGGSPGPTTGGQTNIGGRTVEEVAPPPPRPQTTRPTPPAPPEPAPAARTPPRTPPPPSTAPPRPTTAPTTRPPVTGREVARGNTPVDTGATGQGAGLASGGRFGGGETDLANFCCPDYLEGILQRIDSRWNKSSPDRGTTIVRFTIRRDGTVADATVEKTSGYGTLDRSALAAVRDIRLPGLPTAYNRETLTVHLSFPYGS